MNIKVGDYIKTPNMAVKPHRYRVVGFVDRPCSITSHRAFKLLRYVAETVRGDSPPMVICSSVVEKV